MLSPISLTETPFYGGLLRLRQPESGYRAAIDPVLLAASLAPRPGSIWLEFGCGVGTASLCLLARCPEVSVIGVEIDPVLAALARENAALNGMAERFQVIVGDVAQLDPAVLPTIAGIFINPPFHDPSASPSPDGRRARATHGALLADWVARAARVLPHKGELALIYRADGLATILAALAAARPSFGGVQIFPLWPRSGVPAKRLLVSARQGSRAPLTLGQGVLLHSDKGGYTAEVDAILRGKSPLPMA